MHSECAVVGVLECWVDVKIYVDIARAQHSKLHFHHCDCGREENAVTRFHKCRKQGDESFAATGRRHVKNVFAVEQLTDRVNLHGREILFEEYVFEEETQSVFLFVVVFAVLAFVGVVGCVGVHFLHVDVVEYRTVEQQFSVGSGIFCRADNGVMLGGCFGFDNFISKTLQHSHIDKHIVLHCGVELRNLVALTLIKQGLRCFGKFGCVEYAEFYSGKLASVAFECEKVVEMLAQILKSDKCTRHVALYYADIPRFSVETKRSGVDGFEHGFLYTCCGGRCECNLQSLDTVFGFVERSFVILTENIEITVLNKYRKMFFGGCVAIGVFVAFEY